MPKESIKPKRLPSLSPKTCADGSSGVAATTEFAVREATAFPAHFGKQRMLVLKVIERQSISAPTLQMRIKQTIAQVGEGLSGNADVLSAEAIGREGQTLFSIIQRRGKECISHRHAIVLPTRIQTMVVVIVHTTHLIRGFLGYDRDRQVHFGSPFS